MGQKRSSSNAPYVPLCIWVWFLSSIPIWDLQTFDSKRRSKSGSSCKPGASNPNHTSNETKQQPEIHISSSKHPNLPQHDNVVSQDVSKLVQQKYGDMYANDLAFKDYQPSSTYQISDELSNGPNKSHEYIECSYHHSAIHGYNSLGANGYGLDPMHRWIGEGMSEQSLIGYSHDGSSSLRQGCTCSQDYSLPVEDNLWMSDVARNDL